MYVYNERFQYHISNTMMFCGHPLRGCRGNLIEHFPSSKYLLWEFPEPALQVL